MKAAPWDICGAVLYVFGPVGLMCDSSGGTLSSGYTTNASELIPASREMCVTFQLIMHISGVNVSLRSTAFL